MIVEKHVDAMSDPESDDESDLVAIDARSRNKALIEFRFRVEEAITGDYLFAKKLKKTTETTTAENTDVVRLWGVPLVQGHDDATDVVLSKFLKAKRYKVHEAFTALRKTLKWRTDFCPNDGAAPQLDNAWFRSGADKEGRPLCYNILGREYQRSLLSLGDQSYNDYLRWRVLCVEKGIQNLNFTPGGVDSIVQIIDLKNTAGPATKEMKLIGKKMITLLHDHYPGLVHKNVSEAVFFFFFFLKKKISTVTTHIGSIEANLD